MKEYTLIIYKANISTMYVKMATKTNIQDVMYLKWREKKKIQKSSLHPSKYTLPVTKFSYTNPPPMSMTTLIFKTTLLFCHE